MSLYVQIVHSTQWVRRNKMQIEQFSAYKGVHYASNEIQIVKKA